MNSVRLHRQIVQKMNDLGLRATAPQRENLAWLCQSLAYSPDCHLATLALQIPLPGQRESLVQRERRYLKNAQVKVARLLRALGAEPAGPLAQLRMLPGDGSHRHRA